MVDIYKEPPVIETHVLKSKEGKERFFIVENTSICTIS